MAPDLFKLGDDLELDLRSYELRRSGRAQKMERIPMELLLFFIERRSQLVSRDEIIERIWGKGVFLDTENSINAAVRKIRHALKDDPDHPHFLQTVIGKGYRFVGSVEEISRDGQGVDAPQIGAKGPDGTIPAAAVADDLSLKIIPPPLSPPERKTRRHFLGRSAWAALALSVLVALWISWWLSRRATASSPQKVMLAVLPFNNLSGDSSQEYLADGMTEEMITQLGSLNPERLGVIARVSAMHYKSTYKSAAEISRELGVQYLLEGSIRRSGKRVRVTAQLIQSRDQTHLWAQDYDTEIGDALRLETEIADSIARQIQVALSRQFQTRLSAKQLVNDEAYDEYLRGLQAWSLRSEAGSRSAIEHFERATKLDPTYALAFAAKARCYALAPIFGPINAHDAMPKARAAAERALQLDNTLSQAHSAMAFVMAHYDYDWDGAEREFRRAIDLNPSDPIAHLFYSNSFLSPHGRHGEAIAEMKQAVAQDPFSIVIQSFLIRTYTWARRWDDAEAQFQKANAINPNFALDHSRMARLYAYEGKYEAAIEEDVKARVLSGESPDQATAKAKHLRKAVADQGARGYWGTLLELSRATENPPEAYVTPFGVAVLFAQLGDRDKAFALLNRAYEERDMLLTEIAVEPGFDDLRRDPRFTELVHRIQLQ